jgi:hypothetical protein
LDTFAEEFVRVPALMSGPDFSRNWLGKALDALEAGH